MLLRCSDLRRNVATRLYTAATVQSQSRLASTSSPTHDIAVLGGGITGLASAWYITQKFPDAKVTIYESKKEFGGWVKSKVVDVGDGEVIFEQGPRSFRPAAPNGTLTLRLAQALDLDDEILVTSKSSPAARNRFIYYPDHLVKMPGPGQSIRDVFSTVFNEPIFQGTLGGFWKDYTTPTRPADLEDESIGSFISRRLSKHTANNILSALYHGIYAGDIWQLSAKSIMAKLWEQEIRHKRILNAFVEAALRKKVWEFCDDIDLQMRLQTGHWSSSLREKIRDCSVFTFTKGTQALPDRLHYRLAHMPNVTLKTETKVTGMHLVKAGNSSPSSQAISHTDSIHLSHTSSNNDNNHHSTTSQHTHVISTISSPVLANILSQAPQTSSTTSSPISTSSPSPTTTLKKYSSLTSTPSVTVGVVNFHFRTPQLLQKLTPPNLPRTSSILRSTLPQPPGIPGFGYLLPQTLPLDQNPERALGVIFDSDITPNLHTTVPPEIKGTQLTVMLGGHWWDDWTSLPTEDECSEMALSVLKRHMGIDEVPAYINSNIQRDCIPQYTVGHSKRMGEAHQVLAKEFGGRLKVAGSWYTGVGLNDCLRSAWEVIHSMGGGSGVGGGQLGSSGSVKGEERTGLENFSWGRPMALVGRKTPGEMVVYKADEGARDRGYDKLFGDGGSGGGDDR